MDEKLVKQRFKELLSDLGAINISIEFLENEMISLTIISDRFKELSHSDRVLLVAQKVVAFTYGMLGNHGLKIIPLTKEEIEVAKSGGANIKLV